MRHDIDHIQQFDTRLGATSEHRVLHRVGWLGVVSFALYVAITVAYFTYRVPLWNPASPVFSGLMLFAEVFGVMTLLLHVFSTWTLVERRAPPAPRDYDADILITTYNEPVDILRNTLLAAKQVRLARAIWLLDDGCRRNVEALANELGVKYIARADRSHAKAGNLNNALQFTEAPFVAILDCDHAPSPEFLERTLGYFIDPSVGFVQTPQDFYNTSSFQHRGSAESKEAWHEQTLFYRVIQAGKDYWNAGFFCGSCAVMRKSALKDIGGIATGTITEDMHTSLRIHKAGWSSVYHSEALAFGLSPATLDQYDTQRLRWARGAMQVWLQEGLLFRGRLTLAQRAAYFMSTITYFEGWQKAVIYFLPMAVLITGSMPLVWTGWPFVGIFLLWFVSGVVVNEIFSRGYAKTIWTEEYNFFRFYTFMKATLALVIPIKWRFSVTPKGHDTDSGIPYGLWPQFVVAIGTVASIIIGSVIYSEQNHLPEGAFIANVAWLTINGAIAIKALSFVAGRHNQQRSEHRFPLPLIGTLQLPDDAGKQTIIAYDASSGGMSIKLPAKMHVGKTVTGELLLPNGVMAFTASVRRNDIINDGTEQVIGLAFEWASDADADPLNSCLYGNSLQWDINNWSETRRFDLAGWFQREDKGNSATNDWEIGRLNGASTSASCLVQREENGFRILSYEPLSSSDVYSLRFGNDTEADLLLDGLRHYSVGGGRVYLGTLRKVPNGSMTFHREPKWTRSAGT